MLHAVAKLRRICRDVTILSGNEALGEFAPVVADLHEGCGPMGGIEAALAHSTYVWNLILPVDVPFLPAAFLDWWVRMVSSRKGMRLGMFRVGGVPQPALLMIHQEVGPYLGVALEQGEYKLMPVLQRAAEDMAAKGGKMLGEVFLNLSVDEHLRFDGSPWARLAEAQKTNQSNWFVNLNTPEDFKEAEGFVDGLDAE